MHTNTRQALSEIIDRDTRVVADCHAAVERAVDEGRLNLAKVLRATAHTSRIRALALARLLDADTAPAASLTAVIDRARASAVALDEAIAAEGDGSLAEDLRFVRSVSAPMNDILERTATALTSGRDVPESVVGQIISGCGECGHLREAMPVEVCPMCGSFGGEFTLFAPFFSATDEHLGRKQPEELLTLMASQSADLVAAVDGVPEELLIAKPDPSEWCIKEIAGHMVDIAELFVKRLRNLLDPSVDPGPTGMVIPWRLLDGQGYPDVPMDAIVGRYSAALSEAHSLASGLDSSAWRTKLELTMSRVMVIDMASWLVNHNIAHLAQIEARVQK